MCCKDRATLHSMRAIATTFVCSALLLAAACCLARDCHAASTVVLAPSGDGVYSLQGLGMEDVAAMDIVVSYDPATLTNPRVSQGSLISGAFIAVNDRVPGQVRMGIIRVTPVRGTGDIATLTFDRRGNAPGKILSLTARFSNSESNTVEAVARVSDAADSAEPVSKPGTGETTDTGAPVPSGIPLAGAGGVFVQSIQPGAPALERQQEEGAARAQAMEPDSGNTLSTSATATSPGAAGMTVSSEQAKSIRQVTSVLDRFREYRGERTVKALMALFERNEGADGFRQEPGVVLSDGKATAKIIFTAKAPGGVTPDFALNSVHLISLKRADERPEAWVAEVKPEKGVYSASFIVSQNGELRELPLTLAPKISPDPKTPGTVTEKAFRRYLRGKGRDLNRDGKRDYIDDYIYTANYAAARQVAVKQNK